MFRLINLYKQNKIDKDELNRRMRSYFGWMKFCNSKNLLRKVEELTGLKFSNWNGKEVNISKFYNKYIHIVEVVDYDNHFECISCITINPTILKVRIGDYTILCLDTNFL